MRLSRKLGAVTLNFADGAYRAETMAKAGAFVDRNEAALPADIIALITKKRKSGDQDAAIDPLSRPEVRAELQRRKFELLVGFQLSEAQMRYNATR